MIRGLIRRDGTLLDTQDALREAALHGHVDGYPLPVLVMALRDYPRKRPSASIIASVTWRRAVLEAIVDYYVFVADRYAMIRGSLIHNGLGMLKVPEGVEVIREKRLRVAIPKFPEKILSGQIDLYYPQHARLEDHKTCTQIPSCIKPDHLAQLAVYYWLLIWHGYPVESVAINYISWHDCCQLTQAELEDGTVGEAIGHKLFQKEHAFIEYVVEGWDVLEAGFLNNEVPSIKECDTRYCRDCPVKWACDQIDVWGEVIDPSEFKQRDFV